MAGPNQPPKGCVPPNALHTWEDELKRREYEDMARRQMQWPNISDPLQQIQPVYPVNPNPPRHPVELVIEELHRVQPHLDKLMQEIEQGERRLEDQKSQLKKLSHGIDVLKQWLAEQMENVDPELREKVSKELFK